VRWAVPLARALKVDISRLRNEVLAAR
jgi:hypothetical protein